MPIVPHGGGGWCAYHIFFNWVPSIKKKMWHFMKHFQQLRRRGECDNPHPSSNSPANNDLFLWWLVMYNYISLYKFITKRYTLRVLYHSLQINRVHPTNEIKQITLSLFQLYCNYVTIILSSMYNCLLVDYLNGNC